VLEDEGMPHGGGIFHLFQQNLYARNGHFIFQKSKIKVVEKEMHSRLREHKIINFC
jgi:chemotaxis methyl-accepting protein methylase